MRPHTKAMLAVQLPIKMIGKTKKRAKLVVKSVNRRAAMTPSDTQAARDTTKVATAKARNRRIGRPTRAV